MKERWNFNDVFSLALLLAGVLGVGWSLYTQNTMGTPLFAVLIGYGLGIYGDRAH